MSDNLKNNESLNELIRYRNNKMTDKERYEFERAMERDPFLAEAFDGFSEFKTSDIEHDLNAIDLITGKKRKRIKPVVYWSAAASLLILVGVFYFFTNRSVDKHAAKEQLSEGTQLSFYRDTTQVADVSDSTLIADTTEVLLADAKVNEDVNKTAVKKIEAERKPEARKEVVPEAIKKKDSVSPAKNLAAVKIEEDIVSDNVVGDALSGTLAGVTVEHEAVTRKSSTVGSVAEIRAEEAVSLDEEVNKRKGINASPAPLGGNSLFNQYLDKNLVYPESVEKQSREVVKVEFKIGVNGEPYDFSILKAPDNTDFSKEAIRVIEAGPKWSPAVKDGIPVVDKVSLRIVFKPNN